MKYNILFHTYLDFLMQLGAREPHSEMFSTNHNDETTFTSEKSVSSNHNAAIKTYHDFQSWLHCLWRWLFYSHKNSLGFKSC